MSVEDNKKLVLSFFENLSSGNTDAILAMMADNATWTAMAKPDKFALAGTKTKAEFAEILKGIVSAMPNLRVTPKGLTAEGDRVAMEGESYGEHTNGKVYNNMYHWLFEVRGGKIQAVREYLDTIHAQDVLVG